MNSAVKGAVTVSLDGATKSVVKGRSRSFAIAVTVCAAAAAIALYAASRTWLVEAVPRPEPLPPTTSARTGGSLVPLLPALALVGLAGAGGLLATGGRARKVVAGLLVVVGVGIPVSLAGVPTRAGVAVGWVLASMLSGLIVAGVGVAAIRRGRSWPTMGARYERKGAKDSGAGDAPPADNLGRRPEVGATVLWDALDRGEDPTKDEI